MTITLSRTGLLLRMLGRIGSDLTGQDLSALFGNCLELRELLVEVVFARDDAEEQGGGPFIVRVLDRGRALGVVHGQTRLVLSLETGPETGELEALARAIKTFQTCKRSHGGGLRLLLHLRPGSLVPMMDYAVRTRGEWFEVRLEKITSRESAMPPSQVVN